MLKKLTFCCSILILIGCAQENERAEAIAKIPVEVSISRFDTRFAQATADSLPGLKAEFPYLFPRQYPDSVWVQKIEDTIQDELDRAVLNEFADLSETHRELERLFQHIRYYFPQAPLPQVITLTSDVDYRNQVIWSDQYLLIALDTYLGKDHPLYVGIQDYLRKNFEKEQIIPDVAAAFAATRVQPPRSRDFMTEMIHYGKILYLKDLLIPFRSDAEKIGYTPEELEWARKNEDQIWRYFVEKELLYSTDPELGPRFLLPAPFSKFYLKLDSEAPARLGQYIGWQIIRKYMERNELPVKEMLQKNAEELFQQSNYKPNK